MDLFSLKGKTAIVVGGSKGLGRGMATGLVEAGADVVIVSRNQAELDETAKEVQEQTGGSIVGIAADVTNTGDINAMLEKVVAMFGHIDVLINSAGFTIRKPFLEYEEDAWDQVMDLQLKSVFLVGQAVARHMAEKGIRGKIVNVGSLTSFIAIKNAASYCAAKAGVVELTRTMALELADNGINVNCIAPGYYETVMTKAIFENPVRLAEIYSRIPMKRFGLPGDLAGAAVFLSSSASDYITGQTIAVDGGWLAS